MLPVMVAVSMLAACTAGAGPAPALKWIEEDEAQKRRLEEAGFPQYIGE